MDGGDGLPGLGIGPGIGDLDKILWRRRYWILTPLLLGTVAATIAAFTLPKVYRSASVLLIESQQIPTSLVASPFSNVADERIGKIRQYIVSRTNLAKLIDDNQLYRNERLKLSRDEVLGKMHDAIGIELVSASAGTTQNSGAGATIAFTLSYTYGDPAKAYAVATQLTAMFIEEDRRLRTEQASGTLTFLKSRADELRDRLIEVENSRRLIQARFAGALPDQALMSAQSTSALRGDLARIDGETQLIAQQNGLLAARAEDSLTVAEPPGRAEVRRAQQLVARLSATLSDQHPDVVAAREALRTARAALSDEPQARPATAAITSEIEAGRMRIAGLNQRRAQLLAAVGQADRLLSQSPQAAYELNNIEREKENLTQQYTQIRDKQLEAQVAENLQSENKAERFSVVDPPTMPGEPISPKPLPIILGGMFGGLGLGLALVLAWQLLTGAIHGARSIARLTGEEPLAIIPILRPGPPPSLLTGFDRLLLWQRRRVAT